MKVGGSCWALKDGRKFTSAVDADWEFEAESDAVVLRVFGQAKVEGKLCIAFACTDGRVRAMPFGLFRARERRADKEART